MLPSVHCIRQPTKTTSTHPNANQPKAQQERGAPLVAPQHALHKVAEWAPEILAAGQVVLIDEEHVLLEAGIEMRLEPQLSNDGVVMAVFVGVDSVHALEFLLHQGRERLGERDADAAGEDGFVVDIALHPGHQLLDVSRRRHLGGLLVVLVVLPEVLEPGTLASVWVPPLNAKRSQRTRRLPSSRGTTEASRTL